MQEKEKIQNVLDTFKNKRFFDVYKLAYIIEWALHNEFNDETTYIKVDLKTNVLKVFFEGVYIGNITYEWNDEHVIKLLSYSELLLLHEKETTITINDLFKDSKKYVFIKLKDNMRLYVSKQCKTKAKDFAYIELQTFDPQSKDYKTITQIVGLKLTSAFSDLLKHNLIWEHI